MARTKKQQQHADATSNTNINHSGASSGTPSVTSASTGSTNASTSSNINSRASELQQAMQYLMEALQWGKQSQGQSQGGSPLSTSGDNINTNGNGNTQHAHSMIRPGCHLLSAQVLQMMGDVLVAAGYTTDALSFFQEALLLQHSYESGVGGNDNDDTNARSRAWVA
jgi:hypothetical protein